MPAAVPQFAGDNFDSAPPGHRFRLYFDGWTEGWRLPDSDRDRVVGRSTTAGDAATARALIARQRLLLPESARCFVVEGETEAPFVTGIGEQHPLENGFAFYDPHGIAYLPGSGAKGVVRHAAEELALAEEDAHGWTVEAVWLFFGFDASSVFLKDPKDLHKLPSEVQSEVQWWRQRYLARADAIGTKALDDLVRTCGDKTVGRAWDADPIRFLRDLPNSDAAQRLHWAGALRFHDVFPLTPKEELRVEVLNPHFHEYHLGSGAPTDSQNPQPHFYLTVPARSTFRFAVTLGSTPQLPQALAGNWQALLRAAFERAFENGFGAKTSQGFGRMHPFAPGGGGTAAVAPPPIAVSDQAAGLMAQNLLEAARKQELAKLAGVPRLVAELAGCAENRVNENRVSQIYPELDKLAGDEQKALAAALKGAFQRLKKWDGNLTEKQAKKVARVKTILGEK